MKMNKLQVQTRFNAASCSYEGVAHIQKQCAQILISNLLQAFPEFYPTSILDLGTGTGYVPELLLPFFPNSAYTLNDIAPNMLKTTREKFNAHNRFTFDLGDMEVCHFNPHHLIISNFALQWVNHLEEILYKFYYKSDVLAFSCLLDGTFKEWEDILEGYELSLPIKKYPTDEELKDFLVMLGGEKQYFESRDFVLRFSNAYTFITYLKELGASATNLQIPWGSVKKLITSHNHEFKVTYKVFFAIMKRI